MSEKKLVDAFKIGAICFAIGVVNVLICSVITIIGAINVESMHTAKALLWMNLGSEVLSLVLPSIFVCCFVNAILKLANEKNEAEKQINNARKDAKKNPNVGATYNMWPNIDDIDFPNSGV